MPGYAFVALVSVLAGAGIARAIRLPVSAALQWLLAPCLCLIWWTLAIGIGISAGLPMRTLAVPVWLVTALAAAHGAWSARRQWTPLVLAPLGLAVVLPVVLLPYDFVQGLASYVGGPSPDGWSYVAYGQYLWEWPKGVEGSLAPLYQYAAHLTHTRFIASAMLGFLSPITGGGGDTQAATGCFVAWSLFVFGASCAALGMTLGLRRRWLLALVALAVTSRWIFGAVQVHNYDNLLAVSYLPFTLALVAGLDAPGWRVGGVMGAVLAATFYGYPELAGIIVFGAALAAARRALVERRWREWLVSASAAALLALVLLVPSWSDLVSFISAQVNSATGTGPRPGEGSFRELIEIRDWIALYWGLDVHPGPTALHTLWMLFRNGLGLVLWILMLAGGVRLVARGHWDIVVLGSVLTAGAVFMAVQQQYGYGAYKLLQFGCAIAAACIVAGLALVADWTGIASPTGTRRRALPLVAAAAGGALACALAAVVVIRAVEFHRSLPATSIEPYRVLTEIDAFTGSDPLLVSVDNPLANQWAVYFLRRHQIRLAEYRGYMAMPHVVPLMERSKPIDLASIRYVVTDQTTDASENEVWSGGLYELTRLPVEGAAILRGVENPNGHETVDGRSFYWIGRGDTTIDVFATNDGVVMLSGRFFRGPSLPGNPERHLSIRTADATQTVTIDRDGDQSLSVAVRQGNNRISLTPLDRPSVVGPGDPRPLLLGIQGLSVTLLPQAAGSTSTAPALPFTSTCSATFASGWHAVERTGDTWLRWSNGTAKLRISSDEVADLSIEGEFLSFVRPNSVDVSVDGRRVATWTADDPSWSFHTFAPVVVHVPAGGTAVVDLKSRTSPVVQASDPRPLAVAVKDVIVHRLDRPGLCGGVPDAGP